MPLAIKHKQINGWSAFEGMYTVPQVIAKI